MINCRFIIGGCVCCFLLAGGAYAGGKFRYKFDENDTLRYNFVMTSKIKIKQAEYENLARLFNLNNIAHNVEADMTLAPVESGSKKTTVKGKIDRLSSVTLAGDSIYINEGSNWGSLKPGSEYLFDITSRGEIIDFYEADSSIRKQGMLLIQRFFPVFPEENIETGFEWNDSLAFSLVLPEGEEEELQSQIVYRYSGRAGKYDKFLFDISGQSDDTLIQLSGRGYFFFDNVSGKSVITSGFFDINTEVDLAALGLPSGLGKGIPVNLKSELAIKLKNGK
jgi:hypothetical protein